jgi:hypothetical protein
MNVNPAAEAQMAFQGALPQQFQAAPIPPITTESAQETSVNPATYQAMIDTLRGSGVNIPDTTAATAIQKLTTAGQKAITAGQAAQAKATTAQTKATAASGKSDLQDVRDAFAATWNKNLTKVAAAAKGMDEAAFADLASTPEFQAVADAYAKAKPTFANAKADTAWLNDKKNLPATKDAQTFRLMLKALYG